MYPERRYTIAIHTGATTVHVHSCYNTPPKSHTSTGVDILVAPSEGIHTEEGHVIVGDFDLHHPLWEGD